MDLTNINEYLNYTVMDSLSKLVPLMISHRKPSEQIVNTFEDKSNVNIFSNDQDYKMDFYLRFKTKITYLRYKNETIIRLKVPRINFIIAMSILFLIYTCLNIFVLPIFILTLICLKIHLKTNNLIILRFSHFLVNLFTIIILRYSHCDNIDFLIVLLCFSITNFITLCTWYQNFAINFTFISLFYFSCPLYYLKIQKMLFDFIFFLLISFIYAIIERNYKENWVLFNSFKRSERQYKAILNFSLYPEIIIGEKGNIIDFNAAASNIFYFQSNNHENFKNYILNLELDKFTNTVRQVISGFNMQKKRLFILKDSNSNLKNLSSIEENPLLVYKALVDDKCKYYKIIFQNIIWKNKVRVCHLVLIDKSMKYLRSVILDLEQSQLLPIKSLIDKHIYSGIEKK